MTFYESIFLRQFSMKLLGLPTTKHFSSFILGCPQDFNFPWPFCPFSLVSTTSSITVLSVNKARVKNSRFSSLSCLSQPSGPWPVLAALRGKSGLRYVHVFLFNTVMLDVGQTIFMYFIINWQEFEKTMEHFEQ